MFSGHSSFAQLLCNYIYIGTHGVHLYTDVLNWNKTLTGSVLCTPYVATSLDLQLMITHCSRAGFYVTKVQERLKVIALNTNFGYNEN